MGVDTKAVMTDPVWPLDHRIVPPTQPVAVNRTESGPQMVNLLAEMTGAVIGDTVIV